MQTCLPWFALLLTLTVGACSDSCGGKKDTPDKRATRTAVDRGGGDGRPDEDRGTAATPPAKPSEVELGSLGVPKDVVEKRSKEAERELPQRSSGSETPEACVRAFLAAIGQGRFDQAREQFLSLEDLRAYFKPEVYEETRTGLAKIFAEMLLFKEWKDLTAGKFTPGPETTQKPGDEGTALVQPTRLMRDNTVEVTVGGQSKKLLFVALCGLGARWKICGRIGF